MCWFSAPQELTFGAPPKKVRHYRDIGPACLLKTWQAYTEFPPLAPPGAPWISRGR